MVEIRRTKRRSWQISPAVALAAVLGGCAGTPGGSIPYNVQGFTEPDAPQPVMLGETYKIAPLDTLTIKVFQVADLSGDYPVDLSGNISMPLLGAVKAVGLSPRELQAVLVSRLQPRFLTNPDISISVKESALQNVTVEGAVRQPAIIPLKGPTTLLHMIASAGGTSDTANPHRVAVFRQIQGKRMAAAFDLSEIRRGKAEDPPLYAGDIVIVDGSNIKAVEREALTAIPLLWVFRAL